MHLPPPLRQTPKLLPLRGFGGKGPQQGEGANQIEARTGSITKARAKGKEKENQPTTTMPIQPTTIRIGKAARLPHFYAAWRKVTSNKFILRIVKYGYQLQFSSQPKQNSYSPRNYSSVSLPITEAKVKELMFEGALKIVPPSDDQFLSHIFPVPKRTPGEFRIIFDLSDLNLFIRKLTFRMDSYGSIMSLISRGDFFISIDLTDAYHAIAIHPLFRRFLTFVFLSVYYQ